MNAIQIIILLVGAILFTVSFIIPERKSETIRDVEKEEEFIKEAISKEIEGFRYQLDEAAEDAVSHTKDTTERYLDRITNEKMSAISEYSDTVMEQIHKNHEETVFLYDMLNNKHAQIKNTAAELNNIIRSAKQSAETVKPEEKTEAPKVATVVEEIQSDTPVTEQPVQAKSFENLTAEKVEIPKQYAEEKATVKKTSTPKKAAAPRKKASGVEMVFTADNSEMNNNDKILALHKEGKSNMAIARELGLGIGEVKLVIDLFEGIG